LPKFTVFLTPNLLIMAKNKLKFFENLRFFAQMQENLIVRNKIK
jgi:hypothetical protein